MFSGGQVKSGSCESMCSVDKSWGNDFPSLPLDHCCLSCSLFYSQGCCFPSVAMWLSLCCVIGPISNRFTLYLILPCLTHTIRSRLNGRWFTRKVSNTASALQYPQQERRPLQCVWQDYSGLLSLAICIKIPFSTWLWNLSVWTYLPVFLSLMC